MNEVDRLSNSGLYPALPMADKRGGKEQSAGRPPADSGARDAKTPQSGPQNPRPPKSLIDEYA